MMFFCCPGRAAGQDEEITAGLVADLMIQLDSDIIDDREAAEKELVAMSPEVLDYIDVPQRDATPDFVNRVLRIRKRLEKKAIRAATQSSTVTLQGEMSINDAIEAITAQTKNQVVLNPEIAAAAGQRRLTLDWESVEFWTAMDQMLGEGKLAIDVYGGGAGQLALIPSHSGDFAAEDPPAPKAKAQNPKSVAGILQLAVGRVDSTKYLDRPGLDNTNINLLVRWEPRVRPISIEMDLRKLKIFDENNNPIRAQRETTVAGVVQAEIPELSFSVTTPRIDRGIKKLNSIRGSVDVVLPGREETFRFPQIGEIDEPEAQTKSGATVTVHGYEENEALYAVIVELGFDSESNELDSHQGWVFDNQIILEKDDEVQESVSSETLAQNGQSTTIRYFFEKDPKDWDLVYKTPAAIVGVSFDFELTDIPLP